MNMYEPTGRVWRERVAHAAVAALALGIAWALKHFYSRATFEDLRWVLAPSTRLVEWITSIRFELEPRQGYLSREHLYAIVPSCAGVNFMIAAFASLSLGLLHTRSSIRGKLELVGISALAAYFTTLLANAVRIAIAIPLHDARVSFGLLTPDRLHTVVGVVVYFVFLCLLFTAGAKATGARHELAP